MSAQPFPLHQPFRADSIPPRRPGNRPAGPIPIRPSVNASAGSSSAPGGPTGKSTPPRRTPPPRKISSGSGNPPTEPPQPPPPQNPPAPPPPSPANAPSPKPPDPPKRTIAGFSPKFFFGWTAVVATIVLAVIWYAGVSQYFEIRETITVEFRRQLPDGKYEVPLGELLGPRATNYNKYRMDGDGLSVLLIGVKPDGKETVEAQVELAQVPKGSSVNQGTRKVLIENAYKELVATVERLNSTQVAIETKRVINFLDKTPGTNQTMRDQVSLMLNTRAGELVGKGNKAQYLFHTLNDRILYRVTSVEVPAKAAPDAIASLVNPVVDELLSDEAAQDSSSLLRNFANALTEDKVMVGDEINVVSDLFENTGKLSFEKVRGKHNKYAELETLSKPSEQEKILRVMKEVAELPNLTGVTVHLYLTGPQGTDEEVEKQEIVYKLWKALLESKEINATVVKHNWGR